MYLSPINYQPQIRTNNYNRQNSSVTTNNVRQQNSNVNFTGSVGHSLKCYVVEFAKNKFKSDTNAANKFVEETMDRLKTLMERYHPDIYIDSAVRFNTNTGVKYNEYVFRHRKLPVDLLNYKIGYNRCCKN